MRESENKILAKFTPPFPPDQLTSSHERTPLPAAPELISDTAVSQSVSIYTMEQENERPRKKQENGKTEQKLEESLSGKKRKRKQRQLLAITL